VILLFDPSVDVDGNPQNEALKAADEELQAMAKECGDFTTRKLNIETKFHNDIRGQNDTTLNAWVILFLRRN